MASTPQVRCPVCFVSAGSQCVTIYGNEPTRTHAERAARELGFDSARQLRQHYRVQPTKREVRP